jgi:hypothetical protein
MRPDENVAIMRRGYEAFNKGDSDLRRWRERRGRGFRRDPLPRAGGLRSIAEDRHAES